MNDFSEVIASANTFGVNVQFRMVCPFCENKERSFAACLKDDGSIVYICHRNKCGEKGSIKRSTLTETIPQSGTRITVAREVLLRDLSYEEQRVLKDRWNFVSESSIPKHWKWDEKSNRLAMPVLGPKGQMRGWVLRTFAMFTKPKVLSVKILPDEPFIHWAGSWGNAEYELVIVEDIPSAERMAKLGRGAVALLGTHINTDMLKELRKQTRIIIALDEDASEKALKYKHQLSLMFDKIRVILLTKDIKDMKYTELSECLSAI